MLYAPPTSADALHRAHPPSVSNAVAALTGTATGGVMLNLASRRDEHARSAVHAPDPQVTACTPSLGLGQHGQHHQYFDWRRRNKINPLLFLFAAGIGRAYSSM